VTANSAAKWAEQISANSLAQFSDR
jgi:hypothetical protein